MSNEDQQLDITGKVIQRIERLDPHLFHRAVAEVRLEVAQQQIAAATQQQEAPDVEDGD